MPKSTHRRKGENRPRASQTRPPERNPEPSPPWVPVVAVALLVVGLLIIIAGYVGLGTITASWPIFGSNWGLIVGFVLLLGGFLTLTKWQ